MPMLFPRRWTPTPARHVAGFGRDALVQATLFYDVNRWLKDHGIQPRRKQPRSIRNGHWAHMIAADVISMATPAGALVLATRRVGPGRSPGS
jgi:hypothetical protein